MEHVESLHTEMPTEASTPPIAIVSSPTTYSGKEVCERLSINRHRMVLQSHSLKYYEDQLHEYFTTTRTEGNHRRYSDHDVTVMEIVSSYCFDPVTYKRVHSVQEAREYLQQLHIPLAVMQSTTTSEEDAGVVPDTMYSQIQELLALVKASQQQLQTVQAAMEHRLALEQHYGDIITQERALFSESLKEMQQAHEKALEEQRAEYEAMLQSLQAKHQEQEASFAKYSASLEQALASIQQEQRKGLLGRIFRK